jgi:hypothetical protein
MRRRREPVDPALEGILTAVEAAKDGLVAAVPSPRGAPGRPLAEAVAAFEDGLRDARSRLDGWTGGRDDVRRSCMEAIDGSLARAERLRLDAPTLDYEGLVAVLGDLIAPLDAFAGVDRW